ncbi:hypothetical protein C900_00320 [Fulvivirga imtechensis AK7]|uniref:N-acetyltransferase domain-containing protein n=1 Tax=Fulvivirga imtechensis AK7 TaxID=1237149 RepID=L8JHZ0_9BACT|nr:hypothetical protein [Fulvivirga imtechensis]ELR68486.1 hypothetical protein C900_00320 [Fulvivirga imtechensis AK7]
MNIVFKNIYEQKDEALKQKVISFWAALNAIPPQVDINARANELVFMALDNDQVIGVTTAQRAKIKQLNDNYFYAFRTLIHPDYRIPGLVDKLAVLTRDYFGALYQEQKTDCIGLITLVENEQMKQQRREAVYPSTGFVFIGRSKAGHHLRVCYFPGAKI